MIKKNFNLLPSKENNCTGKSVHMCSRYFPQPALIAFFLFSCGAVCHNCLKMCFSMFLLDHIVLGCALKLDYDCKQNMSSMPKRSIPQTTGVQHHSPLKPLLNGNLNSFLRMKRFFSLLLNIGQSGGRWQVLQPFSTKMNPGSCPEPGGWLLPVVRLSLMHRLLSKHCNPAVSYSMATSKRTHCVVTHSYGVLSPSGSLKLGLGVEGQRQTLMCDSRSLLGTPGGGSVGLDLSGQLWSNSFHLPTSKLRTLSCLLTLP